MRQLVDKYKFGSIEVSLYDDDLKHAMDSHPGEVTLEKIKSCILDPDKVIESLNAKNACLFYEKKDEEEYFVVVVHLVQTKVESVGEIRTAYDSTYIKKGKVLFDKEESK